MTTRTIYHPYGLKAEVDITPRRIAGIATATQTVRIGVDKTCEAVEGWCRAYSANDLITFDDQSRFEGFFDPHGDGTKSHFRKKALDPVTCTVALKPGVRIGHEKVTVRLVVTDDTKRLVFGDPDVVIVLTLG